MTLVYKLCFTLITTNSLLVRDGYFYGTWWEQGTGRFSTLIE